LNPNPPPSNDAVDRAERNTQPDFTVFYTALDGRKLTFGRILRASAGTATETPWFWLVEFHQRDKRPATPRGNAGEASRRATDHLPIFPGL